MKTFEDWSYIEQRWDLRPFEIVEYLSKGLQPYNKNSFIMSCPKKYNHSYIKISERLDNAKKLKFLYDKIQTIVNGVAKYLKKSEEYTKKHYKEKNIEEFINGKNIINNIIQNNRKVIVSEEYYGHYKKIFDAIGDIKILLQSEPKNCEINNFLKNSGIDFETSYQPTRFDLFSTSPKKISKIHLEHIQGIRFIYKNCEDQKRMYIKNYNSLKKELESIDWSSWDNFETPLSDNLFDDFINILGNKMFKVDDIENIEKEYSLGKKITKTDQKNKPVDIKHLVKVATIFCKTEKQKNGQEPLKHDVQKYLEKHLGQKKIQPGRHRILSETNFREIWANIPENYRRKIGVRTKS